MTRCRIFILALFHHYCLGLLDRASTAVVYQLPQVACSTLCPTQVSTFAAGKACTDLDGKHIDPSIHRPSMWSTCPPSPTLESAVAQVATRHLHSGQVQKRGRCTLMIAHDPGRMETPTLGGPADLRGFRGRRVCLLSQGRGTIWH